MPPSQSFSPGQGPQQQPPQPQQPPTPQAPHYGYGAAPQFQQPQPQYQQQFRQNVNGQYEVVPPPVNGGRSGHNPYEFIVAPNVGRTSGLGVNLTSGNFLMKMGLLVGAVVVVLIIAGILISSLAPKGSVPGLISITQRQQEIIRISTEATTEAQNEDTKNFVADVEATVTTSQTNILGFLTTHGTKVSPKQLALDKDAQTDTQLTAAASANNYDITATEQLAGQLQTYDALLQTTFSQSNSATVKQMLQADYNGSQLLLKQAKNIENELGSQ